MITVQLVMRLGKPMEHLQAALRASASDRSSVETLFLIAKHVGYFAFLSYDAIAWVCHSICKGQSTQFCVLSLGTRSQVHQLEKGDSRKSVEEVVPILVCWHLIQFGTWKSEGKPCPSFIL